MRLSVNVFGSDPESPQQNPAGNLRVDSKITPDGDCNHEIKRHLPLERKPMTNLGSILKSRDNNLLMKIHLFKAMIFPVVICGCESWSIKKAECQSLMLLN